MARGDAKHRAYAIACERSLKMENYYYYQEKIFEEQVTTNEYLEDLKEDIKITNTYLNSILLFVAAVSILIAGNMVHHLLDKFYSRK